MNLLEAIKICLRKSFTIKGRASKAEFWWFYLFFLIVIVACTVSFVTFLDVEDFDRYFINLIFIFILLQIPVTTAKIRRLHDINQSGWAVLVSFIPYIGEGLILWYLRKSSVDINNSYDISDKSSITDKASQTSSSESETKLCQFCGEIIKSIAIKCKHCKSDL